MANILISPSKYVQGAGELKKVGSGQTSELIELWSLCNKPCDVDFKNDESIDNLLAKI